MISKRRPSFFGKYSMRKKSTSGDKTYSLSREKFFLIGDVWIAIMEGESLSEKTYNHVAFKVSEKNFDMYVQRIKKLGLDIKEARSRVDGEAQSIYFYDYDNHLFEIHTGTLNERLQKYQR